VNVLNGMAQSNIIIQCAVCSVMGVDGAINTIARIASPLIMGDVYRRSGAAATFGIASAAVFASSAIALIRRFVVVRGQRKMAAEVS